MILKRLLPNIWPKDDNGVKIRVVTALALLIGGKVRSLSFSALFVYLCIKPDTLYLDKALECPSALLLQIHYRYLERPY